MKERTQQILAALIFLAIIAAGIGLVIGIILWIGVKTVSAIFAAFVAIAFIRVVYETIRDEINHHRGK